LIRGGLPTERLVAHVIDYAPGRGAVHGLRLLEGYRRIIHCDGYEAYKTMTRTTRADALFCTLAFC
jgi:hypothetical protein